MRLFQLHTFEFRAGKRVGGICLISVAAASVGLLNRDNRSETLAAKLRPAACKSR